MRKLLIIFLSLTFIFLNCGNAKQETETPEGESDKAAVESETTEIGNIGLAEEEKMAMEPPVWGSIQRTQNPIVVLETNHGTIELELYWKETPKTAESFLYLTNNGYYDSLTFHRIVPNFVVQGGDPLGNGTGGPGYNVPFEKANTKHLRGSLGMARSQDPNSGGSQFYICLRDLPNLDGNYVVFGKVVKGMDMVDKIAQVPTGPDEFPEEQVIMTKVYEKK